MSEVIKHIVDHCNDGGEISPPFDPRGYLLEYV